METKIRPRLSVIIAAHNGKKELLSCLSPLKEQYSLEKPDTCEIIVVGYLNEETKKCIEEKFPMVKALQTSTPLSVPNLRSLGIKASKGDILAMLEDHCVPANDWIQTILSNHQIEQITVVGGAVENNCTARITDWAVYFFEYSTFMNPISKRKTTSLPGNNISYKNFVIQYFEDMLEQNLWESFWHSRLIQKGIFLTTDPDMIVYHNRSFHIMKFWLISFKHGYNYAVARLQHSLFRQTLWIVFSTFLPLILTFRVGYCILKKQRHLKEFIASSPIILWFYIGWTLGEIIGTFVRHPLNKTGWGRSG